VNQLSFKGAKKAFSYGIIPTIAFCSSVNSLRGFFVI
jgi:hypothetical protein